MKFLRHHRRKTHDHKGRPVGPVHRGSKQTRAQAYGRAARAIVTRKGRDRRARWSEAE